MSRLSNYKGFRLGLIGCLILVMGSVHAKISDPPPFPIKPPTWDEQSEEHVSRPAEEMLALSKDIRRNMRQANQYCAQGPEYSIQLCIKHNQYLADRYKGLAEQHPPGTRKYQFYDREYQQYHAIVEKLRSEL